MVAFYTCDAMSSVTSIPQIADKEAPEVKLEGRMSQSRFESYLNQTFSQWDKKIEKVISGWAESSTEVYQARCEQMAKDLLGASKIGMSTYHESSKIFFLHKDQMPEAWRIKMNFQAKKLKENAETPSSLCFIIIHKPYKLKAAVKSIQPEIVTVEENSNY